MLEGIRRQRVELGLLEIKAEEAVRRREEADKMAMMLEESNKEKEVVLENLIANKDELEADIEIIR